jgi:transcriptional regulator with XRE-family HTH domain
MLAAGVGQRALARAVGVSAPSVHAWVRRPTSIRAEHLIAAARVLGVSVDWLMTGRGQMRGAAGAQIPEPLSQSLRWLHDDELAPLPGHGLVWTPGYMQARGWTVVRHRCWRTPDGAMEPTVPVGTDVIVDTMPGPVAPGRVYAVEVSGVRTLRRIDLLPGATPTRARLRADNLGPLWASIECGLADVTVYGQVVWAAVLL